MAAGKPIVLFHLKPGVSDERRSGLLTEIESWELIGRAGRLLPNTQVEALQRAYLATLESEEDASQVVARLRELPEVESASLPAPRYLIA